MLLSASKTGREVRNAVSEHIYKADIWLSAAKEGNLSLLVALVEFVRSSESALSALPEDRREAKLLSMCNKANRKGLTPLHLACKNGHADCVRFLIMLVSHFLQARSRFIAS